MSDLEVLSNRLQAMLEQFLVVTENVRARRVVSVTSQKTSNHHLDSMTNLFRTLFVNSIYQNQYGHYHVDENPLHVHHNLAKAVLGLVSLAEREGLDLMTYVEEAVKSADDSAIQTFIREASSFRAYVTVLTEQVLEQIKAEPSSLLLEPVVSLFQRKA